MYNKIKPYWEGAREPNMKKYIIFRLFLLLFHMAICSLAPSVLYSRYCSPYFSLVVAGIDLLLQAVAALGSSAPVSLATVIEILQGSPIDFVFPRTKK